MGSVSVKHVFTRFDLCRGSCCRNAPKRQTQFIWGVRPGGVKLVVTILVLLL